MFEEFNGRVFVPSNIKSNKKAVIGKFDLREIFFIVIGLSAFGILFNFLIQMFSNGLALLISLSVAGPILVSGFIRFDGMKIEEYLIVMRANKVLSNTVRINNADNLYERYENYTKPKAKSKYKIKETKNSNEVKKSKKSKSIFNIFNNTKRVKKRK